MRAKSLASSHDQRRYIRIGLVLAVIITAILLAMLWPRSIRVSGKLGDEYAGREAYLQLMIFDAEIGGKLLKTIEYGGVPVAKDGSFELNYSTRLGQLPGQSFLQVCVNDPNHADHWSGAIAVCSDPTTPASPTGVKGVSSNSKSQVSCTRRVIRSSAAGLIDKILGTETTEILFDDFCNEVVTQKEYIQRTVNNSITNKITETIITTFPPQTLRIDGNILSISAGNNVELPDLGRLYLDGTQLGLTTGSEVDLSDLSGSTEYSAGMGIVINSNVISSVLGATIDGGEVTDNSITNADLSPSSVGTSEIADASVLFADISDNGCTTGEVMSWNGSAWACAAAGVDTDDQTLSLVTNILTIQNGNSVNLSSYLDNTDSQDLSLVGNILSLTNDASTVNLSSYLDNTDVLAGLSCANGEIVKWNGSAWTCAADADTDTQDLSLIADTLSLVNGGSVNLSAFLDNTDNQDLVLTGNILSLTNDATTVNLSSYLDNTDNQNLFVTIDVPSGTDPTADNTTDTLTLAEGAGITITGNGATDTVTIAAVVGISIESGEITDGTITSDDLGTSSVGTDEIANASIVFADWASNSCNNGEIPKFNGSVWVCAADNDTTLSEATIEAYIFDADNVGTLSSGTLALDSLSYTGTLDDANVNDALTISSAGSVADGALGPNVSLLGSSIESSEITNGTILFADLAGNACNVNEIIEYNGSAWICGTDNDTGQNLFQTIATPGGTNPVADTTTDTLTLADGSGITITGDGLTDTITIAAVVGATIESGEISDLTIIGGDIANDTIALGTKTTGNYVATITNGSGISGSSASEGGAPTLSLGPLTANWDQTGAFDIVLNNAASELSILESAGATFFGTLDVVDLSANRTYTLPDVGGALTVLGQTIESGEITDGTITSDDVNDGSLTGTDIQDGTIANADLANSSLTITTGNGLANGGSVSLGNSVTLNIGAGNGITVNADDITVRALTSADGLSPTTSSGSGLEVLTSGVGLLQGCSDGQILKWNETTDVWACGADNSGSIAPDSLDYIDFEDTLNLDATTTTVLGANNLITNLDSTGDVIFQDNAVTFLTISDDGAFSYILDNTDNPAFDITNAGSGNVTTNLSGTGDFIVQDNGTAFVTFSDLGGVLLAPTGTSDVVINQAAGVNTQITATAAPTVDQFAITNAGQAVTTAGADGLSINYVGGAASVEAAGARIDLTPGGTAGGVWNGLQIVANTTGAVAGVTENGVKLTGPTSPGAGTEIAVVIDANWDVGLQIGSRSIEPATPPADNEYIFAWRLAGRSMLAQKEPSGVAYALQPGLFQNSVTILAPSSGTGNSGFGNAWTVDTTASHPAPTEAQGYAINFATAAAGGDSAGISSNVTQWFRGSTSGSNGFFYVARIGTPDVGGYGAGATGTRIWVGLTNQVAGTNSNADNPAGHYVGFQYSTNRGDTNWQFMTKDNVTQNVVNTTMAFAASKVYDLYFYTPPQGTTIYWRIENLSDGTMQEGSTAINLPGGSIAMRSDVNIRTLSAVARNLRLAKIYIESDR